MLRKFPRKWNKKTEEWETYTETGLREGQPQYCYKKKDQRGKKNLQVRTWALPQMAYIQTSAGWAILSKD